MCNDEVDKSCSKGMLKIYINTVLFLSLSQVNSSFPFLYEFFILNCAPSIRTWQCCSMKPIYSKTKRHIF